jgi:hypothetical protein
MSTTRAAAVGGTVAAVSTDTVAVEGRIADFDSAGVAVGIAAAGTGDREAVAVAVGTVDPPHEDLQRNMRRWFRGVHWQ